MRGKRLWVTIGGNRPRQKGHEAMQKQMGRACGTVEDGRRMVMRLAGWLADEQSQSFACFSLGGVVAWVGQYYGEFVGDDQSPEAEEKDTVVSLPAAHPQGQTASHDSSGVVARCEANSSTSWLMSMICRCVSCVLVAHDA